MQPERVYRAATYVRLSVEDNNCAGGNQESIQMQRYICEKYIEGQPDMFLCGLYSDNGETGTDFHRPAFEALMEKVREGEVDCIVVKDLSRFGRNYVEAGYYLEKIFPYLGVRFVAVNDHYDSLHDKSGCELAVSVKNLVNDLYAKDISDKICSSLDAKRKSGEYIGAFPPYGYLKSPKDKHKLVADPDTAPVVKKIFQWRLEGAGFTQIARRLNDRGIPSPSMYRYMKGHQKKEPSKAGAIWQAQRIKELTANPVYAGHVAQGKNRRSLGRSIPAAPVPKAEWIIVQNTHEPLVGQDIFDKVQELTEERHQKYCAIRGKYETKENIFKGLLICGDCGTKMVRCKSVSPTGTARYAFICRVYVENMGKQGCGIKRVGEPELEKAVLGSLEMQIGLALGLEKKLAKAQSQPNFQKKCQEMEGRIGQLQKKVKRNAVLRSSLFEAYSDHTLTEAEYLSMKEEYDKEATELKEKLSQLEQEYENGILPLSPQNHWIAFLKKCRKTKAITRKMAVELIESIYVSGYNEIKITWNFQDEFARLAEEARMAEAWGR